MIERTDEVLAQRFRERGDREALSALIERNQGPIYAYLLRLLKNPHDAEEAAQEVFVRMLRGLPGYDPDLPFRPWLYRIALNCARTAWERRKMQSERERQSSGPAAGATPVDAAVRNEVLRMVDDLPDAQREAVTLHYCQGLSHSEVASVLDVPAGTVATRIHTGLQSLRTRLAALGIAFAGLQLEQVLGTAEAATAPGSIVPAVLKTAAVQGGLLVTKTKLSLVVAVGIACTVGGGVAGYAVRANRVERIPEVAAVPTRPRPVAVASPEAVRPAAAPPPPASVQVPAPTAVPAALPAGAGDAKVKVRRLAKFLALMIRTMDAGEQVAPMDEKDAAEILALMADPELRKKAEGALTSDGIGEFGDELTLALFEEFDVQLSDAQKTQLGGLFKESTALQKKLEQEGETAVDRKIAELRSGREGMEKIRAVLTPDQRVKIAPLTELFAGMGQGVLLNAETPDQATAALLDSWSQKLTPLNDQERARASQSAGIHVRQLMTLQEELRVRYGDQFVQDMADRLSSEGKASGRSKDPAFREKADDAYARLLEVERQARHSLLSVLPEKADALRKGDAVVYLLKLQK
jgi:RNA polymerase sigma-70 factor (ECF subfamily)